MFDEGRRLADHFGSGRIKKGIKVCQQSTVVYERCLHHLGLLIREVPAIWIVNLFIWGVEIKMDPMYERFPIQKDECTVRIT